MRSRNLLLLLEGKLTLLGLLCSCSLEWQKKLERRDSRSLKTSLRTSTLSFKQIYEKLSSKILRANPLMSVRSSLITLKMRCVSSCLRYYIIISIGRLNQREHDIVRPQPSEP